MTAPAQNFDRLQWPPGWPRAKHRVRGQFGGWKPLSVTEPDFVVNEGSL